MAIPWEEFLVGIMIGWIKLNKKNYTKKYIYKIENNINHKVYIGQSVNCEARFKQHLHDAKLGKLALLPNAIRKYGEDNFSYEILGEYENYNEMEKYWIAYYQSNNRNYGYNLLDGGEEPPVGVGGKTIYEEKIIDDIINQLITTDKTIQEISESTGVSYSMIIDINKGARRKRSGINYPIRPIETYDIKQERINSIKHDLMYTSLSQKEIAKKHGVGRTCVTNINNGRTDRDNNIDYPIRKKNK